MAKITRKAAKIFGSSAGINEIAEFGSLAAGTPVFTTDPDTIQSLSNFLGGWFNAVVGSNSPAIEDMNALCYLFAYQIAYILQNGVAEYNSTTTYFIGSLATDSAGTVYASLTDNNVGNALTDSSNWAQPVQNGLVTPDSLPQSMTLRGGSRTTYWPNLTVGSGKTLTVPSGASLIVQNPFVVIGTLTITGTGVVQCL